MIKLMILVFMLISFCASPKDESRRKPYVLSGKRHRKSIKVETCRNLTAKGKKFKVIDVETGFTFMCSEEQAHTTQMFSRLHVKIRK